jgi:putative MATE family efflux protein
VPPSDPDLQSDITEGALARPMLELAWPMVVIQLLQVAYNVADTLWLGRYSADAVGALSLAFPLIFFVISVGGGFTTAGSILVAQYTGADSEGSAGKAAGQTLVFVGAVATSLAVAGFFLTADLLGLLPASVETAAQVVPLAEQYMEVFFLGMPFLFGFFVFSALMRGYGDTRTPMRVMAVSVAVNVLIDPVLIFGWGPAPELGIEGAALATVFSRGVATVIGLYLLFVTGAGPRVGRGDLVPDFGVIWRIVRVGVPSALEQSTSALAMITLTAMVATFAPAVVTAYGLGNRLVSIAFLPAMGLGRATNTMVGQNLGADKPERAERAVWLAAKVAAGVLLVAGVIAALFPEPIVGVFMTTGTEQAALTIEYGSDYLRIRSVEFLFIGIFQVLLGAYRGAGSTKTAMVFSVVALWLGRVPTVYYLAFEAGMGPRGVWIGMALGTIVGAIAAAAWFTRGTWKRTVIEDDDEGDEGDDGGDAAEGAPTDAEGDDAADEAAATGPEDGSEAATPD